MPLKQRIKRLEKLVRDQGAGSGTPLPIITFVDIVRIAEGEIEPPPGFEEAYERIMRNLREDKQEEER